MTIPQYHIIVDSMDIRVYGLKDIWKYTEGVDLKREAFFDPDTEKRIIRYHHPTFPEYTYAWIEWIPGSFSKLDSLYQDILEKC